MTQQLLKRILLVDDDEDIRRVGHLALERVGGFDVEICGSGKEALRKAPAFKADLILLDVMMPQMDGITLFEFLSVHPELGDVPVIFITAKAQKPEIARYLVLGAIGVIKKPFDPMKLADKVRTIWARRQGERSDIDDDEVEALRELVNAYRRKLADHLDKLDELLSRTTAPASRQSLLEMKQIAHKLAGSGAMFGLPEVSEVCAQFETLVDDLLEEKQLLDVEKLERLDGLCRRLRKSVDDESGPRPGV